MATTNDPQALPRWSRRAKAMSACCLLAAATGLAAFGYVRSTARSEITAAGLRAEPGGLLEALTKGRTELLPAYRRIGQDVAKTPRSIEAAVMSGSAAVLAAVLEGGARVQDEPNAARLLPIALRSGDAGLVDAVLKLRPLDPALVPQAYEELRRREDWRVFARLAREPLMRAWRDAGGNGLAHLAARAATPDAWDALAAGPGADLKAANARGETPLHVAANAGHPETVRAVLRSGVDATAKDQRGHTALDIAFARRSDAALAVMAAESEPAARLLRAHAPALIENGLRSTVLALVGRGMPLDEPGPKGLTPLAMAVHAGDAVLVGALLDKGARPDAPSRISGLTGVTPLMLAAVGGKEDLVRSLLAHGADASLAASNGATAVDFAARNGHARLASLLQH